MPAIDPIVDAWVDVFHAERRTSPAARRAVLASMGLGSLAELTDRPDPVQLGRSGMRLERPAELVLEDGTSLGTVARLPRGMPHGYHLLRTDAAERLLIVAPPRCLLPPGYRAWAWAVQVHAARSARSWGIGDLGDLRELAAWSAGVGAGAVLASPMGAPNPAPVPEASPYYPSTRRFRNPLLVRIGEVPGVDGTEVAARIAGLASEARRLNGAPLIDRGRVQALKLEALERIWASGAGRRPDVAAALDAYRAEQGPALRDWATFVVLTERFGPGWRAWQEAYRSPRSPDVRRLAAASIDRVAFHEWVQWLIDEQLRRAGAAGVRLVMDLPIGFDPGGFDAWSWQELLAGSATVGAPPDRFNPIGQDWGLPPFVPHRLRAARLGPFIETVRAVLRSAGGLRIDHVLGLFRLWWIPGGDASLGAYVRYPADELLAVLAIESERAGALIVGEDLGTVERGVRRTLSSAGLLCTRLVYFERRPPRAYPRQALAAVTTHDLPTVVGAWTRRDLDDVRAAGLAPDARSLAVLRDRVARVAGLTTAASAEDAILAVHAAVAASPSCLVSATLEDALRVPLRPNLPGTTSAQRPNWSMALPSMIEGLASDPFVARLARALDRG